jgi:hypothetical protein
MAQAEDSAVRGDSTASNPTQAGGKRLDREFLLDADNFDGPQNDSSAVMLDISARRFDLTGTNIHFSFPPE